MTNNLHHPRAGIKTVLFSLGLGYHQIQIIELEFLQRRGTQIRVNTWTGSYAGSSQSALYLDVQVHPPTRVSRYAGSPTYPRI